jgi:uncharacterized protein (DUF2147 family)
MKRLTVTFVTLVFALTMFAQNEADRITGIWVNGQKNIRIEFFKTTIGYAARIVWLKEPDDENGKPKLDVENPNPSLRNKPLVGTTIIYNLKFDGKNYVSGKIYAPRKGMTADCSIRLISADKIEITGKKGFVNEKKIWTRFK